MIERIKDFLLRMLIINSFVAIPEILLIITGTLFFCATSLIWQFIYGILTLLIGAFFIMILAAVVYCVIHPQISGDID